MLQWQRHRAKGHSRNSCVIQKDFLKGSEHTNGNNCVTNNNSQSQLCGINHHYCFTLRCNMKNWKKILRKKYVSRIEVGKSVPDWILEKHKLNYYVNTDKTLSDTTAETKREFCLKRRRWKSWKRLKILTINLYFFHLTALIWKIKRIMFQTRILNCSRHSQKKGMTSHRDDLLIFFQIEQFTNRKNRYRTCWFWLNWIVTLAEQLFWVEN